MRGPARLPGARALLLGALALLPAAGAAQEPALPAVACAQAGAAPVTAGGALRDFARLLELAAADSFGVDVIPPIHVVRPSRSTRGQRCEGAGEALPPHAQAAGADLRLLPVALGTWVNTGYAEDRENGLVWAGRGLSSSVAFGLAGERGALSFALVPGIAWQQNADFFVRSRELPGYSPWVHPMYVGIDLPQRFGADAFVTLDPWGQSYLRGERWGLAAGWSHESVRIGPSLRNPILMGGSGPGFHHLFAGTSEPFDARVATLEAETFIGWTQESDWYDSNADNDRSTLLAWSLAVRPHVLPGLEIGAARVLVYRPDDGLGDLDVSAAFYTPFSANPGGNQMRSLFARYVFTGSGTEIWAEWTRDEDFTGLQELIQEPDHAQGYTVGFQKWTPLGSGGLRVQAEATALQERDQPRPGRPLAVYYVDARQSQGHTHRGQMLGAGIGPGADAQFVAVDWVRGEQLAGVFVERVRRNDGSAAALAEREFYPYDHDTALTGGLRGLFFVGSLSIGGSLSWSRRYSRDFIADDSNVQLVTEVVWWPGSDRR